MIYALAAVFVLAVLIVYVNMENRLLSLEFRVKRLEDRDHDTDLYVFPANIRTAVSAMTSDVCAITSDVGAITSDVGATTSDIQGTLSSIYDGVSVIDGPKSQILEER
jgi:hypothetical protein